jgi:CubicO group peptidase (beta-lactamase class C family)
MGSYISFKKKRGRRMTIGSKMRMRSHTRLSAAVTTIQLVIIIAFIIVAISGVFFFTRSQDSTPPVAILRTNSTVVEENKPIQFSAGDSSDNVGIVSYQWDFGEGTTRAGEDVVFAYSEAGDFTVILTVADKAGNEEKETIRIEVLPGLPWPTNGWITSTPEEQDMDSNKLEEMMEYIDERDIPIDSVIVVRNGNIVLEEYLSFYGPQTIHDIASCTKSITSAIMGIAIREGYIESVDQKVVDFFLDRTIANMDSRKQDMTIEHLLTMTPGFEWNHDILDSQSDYNKIHASDDWTQYTLDRPMAYDPGEEWAYVTGGSHLLSAIIESATGYSTKEFAQEYLFGHLNMSYVEWPQSPEGVYYGAGGIMMRPRDLAKFGYLYLNNGSWDGERILPAEYVARSTESYSSVTEDTSYGYQWWTWPLGVYGAEGLYGQRLYVVPDLDLVVVFNADIREGFNPELMMLYNIIIPACNDYIPLQETYSKYGFSFDYPSGMTITENGIREESASENSGVVQFRSEIPFELINVIWYTSEEAPDLEAFLDELFGIMESGGTEVNNRSPLVTSVKAGHKMVYQPVNITDQGFLITGIVGSWYCDEADQIYTFYYMSLPEIATQEDLQREFQIHLDSLVCH